VSLTCTASSRSAEPVAQFIGHHLLRCQRSLRAAVIRHGLDESELPLVEQNIRIRLWQVAARDAGGAPERAEVRALPWAYVDRAMHSAVRDVRRRRCAHFGSLGPHALPIHELALVGPDDAASRLEFGELCRVVRECVGQLAPSRRAVVALHLQGTDRREIARQMGWSEGRVRNLLSRGLADLRCTLLRRGVGASGFLDETESASVT
jgi:DNA-directed RNA polymerase specialized sigma24 family protein